MDPLQPRPHDPKSGINPFTWILMESARIRLLRQHRTATIYKLQRDMDLAWRKPIWKALDERLTDTEEDRRTTKRGRK